MFVKKKYNGRLVAKKQTGCLLSVVTITYLMLVRLEYLTVGWSALAKQHGVKQLLDVAFLVQDEDILALYAAADLRLRLQDVPDRALLILQRAQRHDVRMKRFPSCIGAAYLRMGLVMRC